MRIYEYFAINVCVYLKTEANIEFFQEKLENIDIFSKISKSRNIH